MRILLLTHAFNSLAQRLHVELTGKGHELAVELDINDRVTAEAVGLFRPHLVIAPFLKRRIQEQVWRAVPCMILHPGPPGDGGPSALDWAILNDESEWGVTVLQAVAELDAGPVWAWRAFPMRSAAKSSLYRFEITEAAVAAVLEAVECFEAGDAPVSVERLRGAPIGRWRDPATAADRRIDWERDDTETVLRKIRSADGHPGVADRLLGLDCRLYDAHPESVLTGVPGNVIARRGYAICRATADGAVWIGHLKEESAGAFKLPAARVLGDRLTGVPEAPLGFDVEPEGDTFQPLRYRERGNIGYVHFDFHNGAMGTEQCRELLDAFRFAVKRPTRVIVLAGGADFWCNGIHLNLIEAAASPADESWRNIQAMDDLCEAIITTTSHLTLAALSGNAGAGGVFLALCADRVIARNGVVLNPHYRNMGNLYGSEYWTYLLPRHVGENGAAKIMSHRLPLGAARAAALGLVDAVGPGDREAFDAMIDGEANQMASTHAQRVEDKRQRRERDETLKPLSDYRAGELERMRLNFYGFDPSYHVARYRFVHRTPHAWTPLYLAPHRRLGWQVPGDGRSRVTA